MKKLISKMEVNNEIEIIKGLILDERVVESKLKSVELANKIYSNESDCDPYFKEGFIKMLSTIIINECSNDNCKGLDVDYIINNSYRLLKDALDIEENEKVRATLSVEIIKILKLLK